VASQGVVGEGSSCVVLVFLSLDYVTKVYLIILNASVIIMRHCVHYVKNKPV
jgi:hypothetical protein